MKKKHQPQPGRSLPACTCGAQREGVGEDHAKHCPLYRQRGSGVPAVPSWRVAIVRQGWESSHVEKDSQKGTKDGR